MLAGPAIHLTKWPAGRKRGGICEGFLPKFKVRQQTWPHRFTHLLDHSSPNRQGPIPESVATDTGWCPHQPETMQVR